MKTLLVISALVLSCLYSNGQITSPIIRAGFGVDAELNRNYFLSPLSGNDDWFAAPGDNDNAGDFVIDTIGAAAVYAGYTSNPNSRFASFVRGMRYPILSPVNGRIYYDAVFIRDNHGTDSTSFTGGSKNGQSPADWSTTISPVLSKNDIVDGYLHVRRDGLTPADSLWFFGAVALMGTTGDRYFDFELYQTDITYNRSTGEFENYGPDAGHTSWQFAADGSTTRVGDIIFTAEYGNTGLTFIEARIWINKASLSITPQAFSWTGSFDGASAGATYGYASIVPKTGGTFYQGLQNSAITATGPFGTIKSGSVPSLQYDPIQFMEFSVNLTKLGLDPMSFTTGSLCNLAFGKVLIKTRTSTSFTASITDFASPFSFRALPQVDIVGDIPLFCAEQDIANIWVLNPLSTSTYSFHTTDGHIVSTGATSIVVDSPGTYIVIQHLLDGCAEGGCDSVRIIRQPDNSCVPLAVAGARLTAIRAEGKTKLQWELNEPGTAYSFIIERAEGNQAYQPLDKLSIHSFPPGTTLFKYTDDSPISSQYVFYRLCVVRENASVFYSREIKLVCGENKPGIRVWPNPAKPGENVYIQTGKKILSAAQYTLSDLKGSLLVRGYLDGYPGISSWFKMPPGIAPGQFLLLTIQGRGFYFSEIILAGM